MQGDEITRIPHVFICTAGTDYIGIRCKTCHGAWMFNKNLVLSSELAIEGIWECPFCKRDHLIKVKED